ncbi:hypothetical protein ACQJBY_050686 [Aegilops geniculata]
MSLRPAMVCFVAWNHETKMESPTSRGSSSPSSFGRRRSSMTPAMSILSEPTFAPLRDPDTETDAAAAPFDYGVDDPSLLPEQPDVGAQDPDATVDNDYYPGGAYYYVQPADDDLE